MLTASRYRLYPTGDQMQRLAVQFGHARWVWNDALELMQRTYRETGTSIKYAALQSRLTALKNEHEWLRDADSQALQVSLQNLTAAFEAFFKKRTCYPRFKSKHDRQSVQYPQRVKIDAKRAYLPKVGWVKAIIHQPIVGRIKTVTIAKEQCGHYYASVLMDDGLAMPAAAMPAGCRFTGVDLGLIDIAVTDDGLRFGNPRHLRNAQKNLARKQRKLARKQKGSRSRDKARKLVARCHERVKNARKDFLHKLSHNLVRDNQAIAVEDLNVKGLVKSRSLSKSISDASWGMLTSFLVYKSERSGKFCFKVGRFFPSSKTCSECGWKCARMPLPVRAWTCEGCGASHDRDVNAARNIGQEADRMLLGWAGGAPASSGGGTISLARRLGASRARSNEAGSSSV